MEVISVKGVSKRFRHRSSTTLKSYFLKETWKKKEPAKNEIWALKDINLSVKKGATLGIVGLNGSGKSTLLKVIARILRPDTGEVKVTGRVTPLIELGAGFHPEFSGRENIYINGMILGLSRREIDDTIDEIIEFAELEDFIDEPVRTYSSGMYSRLGFSIAVNVQPDILLIDEVFAVGDETFIHKSKAKMDEIKRRNKTIIFVTHSLPVVEQWCDEAVWLHKGAVMTQGLSHVVTDRYRQGVFEIEEKRLLEEHRRSQALIVEQGGVAKGEVEGDGGTSAEEADDGSTAPAEAEKDGATRWGNREVEIVSLQLIDGSGKERYNYNTGEDVLIRIEYRAHKPVEDVVCGIAILRADGLWCYGTNTLIDNIKIGGIGTSAVAEILIKGLNLLQGQYFVDVACHSKKGTPYDYHSKLYSFAVSSTFKQVGVVKLDHSWTFPAGFDLARDWREQSSRPRPTKKDRRSGSTSRQRSRKD